MTVATVKLLKLALGKDWAKYLKLRLISLTSKTA